MLKINKQVTPPKFAAWKTSTKNPNYKKLSDTNNSLAKVVKQDLRATLCSEQNGLCAYCCQRLGVHTKIEHMKSQTLHPQHQLDYDNLVLCCDGGETQSRAANQQNNKNKPQTHCDTCKPSHYIPLSPAGSNFKDDKFIYNDKGDIFTSDQSYTDLIENLNLNVEKLKIQRKHVYNNWLQIKQNTPNPSSNTPFFNVIKYVYNLP